MDKSANFLDISIPGAEIEITAGFHASSARSKCSTKHNTVLLATVKKGKIAKGETLVIVNGDDKTKDLIARIEMHNKPVTVAYEGSDVGICLMMSRLRKVLK